MTTIFMTSIDKVNNIEHHFNSQNTTEGKMKNWKKNHKRIRREEKNDDKTFLIIFSISIHNFWVRFHIREKRKKNIV